MDLLIIWLIGVPLTLALTVFWLRHIKKPLEVTGEGVSLICLCFVWPITAPIIVLVYVCDLAGRLVVRATRRQ